MINASSTLKELGAFLDANKLTMAIEHATIWGVFLYTCKCDDKKEHAWTGVDSVFERALEMALAAHARG